MNRRQFLRAAAAASAKGVILLGTHSWAARALASEAAGRRRLVVVFLRGAVDGLNVVVPYGESEYYAARPTIAIPRKGDGAALNLDGHFGLNPALDALIPQWRDGTLAFVQACGSPDPTRSHFDAQDYMESGTPGVKTTADGWMNRVLAALPGHSPTGAVSLGPVVPRILSGRAPVANSALGRGAARPLPLDTPRSEEAFDRLYDGRDALSAAYQQGRAARKQLLGELNALAERSCGAERAGESASCVQNKDMVAADNGAPTPDGFSQDTARLAHLIQRDPTIKLAFMALGGWDTHVNEGPLKGQLANHLKQLGDGLGSFAQQLGAAYGETVILVISEFGRTIRENGNGGTDHGHGNVMWVMGGPIRGGRVYGRWPGLATANLYEERDLAVTTDFREPIHRVLAAHLGLSAAQLARVFPNRPADSGNLASLLRV
ncbi:MAG: DUF1501 domain-containing protein [Candidatus Binataceae bacterium]